MQGGYARADMHGRYGRGVGVDVGVGVGVGVLGVVALCMKGGGDVCA